MPSFFTDAIGVLKAIMLAAAIGIGIFGLFHVADGYGNDNPGAKSQGIKQLMGAFGIALIATQLVPKLAEVLTAS